MFVLCVGVYPAVWLNLTTHLSIVRFIPQDSMPLFRLSQAELRLWKPKSISFYKVRPRSHELSPQKLDLMKICVGKCLPQRI